MHAVDGTLTLVTVHLFKASGPTVNSLSNGTDGSKMAGGPLKIPAYIACGLHGAESFREYEERLRELKELRQEQNAMNRTAAAAAAEDLMASFMQPRPIAYSLTSPTRAPEPVEVPVTCSNCTGKVAVDPTSVYNLEALMNLALSRVDPENQRITPGQLAAVFPTTAYLIIDRDVCLAVLEQMLAQGKFKRVHF